jgi:hypothetical protein
VIEITDQNISSSAYEDTRLLFLSLKAASLKELKKQRSIYAYKQTIEYALDYYSDSELFVVFEYLNFATFLYQ